MKKVSLLILAIFAICVSVSAQSELSFSSSMWTRGGVSQDGTLIRPAQVREVMAENNEALRLYNSGRALYIAGLCIAVPGAAVLGWDLGARLGGGEGNGTLLGIGAAATVTGFIVSILGEGRMRNSVQLYNLGVGRGQEVSLNFGFTSEGGVGLSMRF
jgi:hypothetical protein